MGLLEAAENEAVLKALYDQVKDLYDAAREETQREFDEAKKTTGTTRLTVELDGAPIATTSRTDPKPEARVTDLDLFTKWVRDNYPTEIHSRVVTEIRTAFTARLMKEMTAAGVPRWVDSDTGEIHEVPGVEVRATRKASHSVRLAEGAVEAISAAWQAGRLGHLTLPQITAGGAQ
jgi:hypothetical protein